MEIIKQSTGLHMGDPVNLIYNCMGYCSLIICINNLKQISNMKKTINIDDLTRSLNEFRMNNLNNCFLKDQLSEYLKELGFSANAASAVMAQLLPYDKVGAAKMYKMPSSPIERKFIKGIYDKLSNYRDTYRHKAEKKRGTPTITPSEEELHVKALKKLGYRVSKPTSFDLKAFSQDHPELYVKYLRYETVLL